MKIKYTFRGTDCDNDHCLVVARCRERLLASKWAKQKFDMQRFYLEKLSDAKVKEQDQAVALENRDDNGMNRALENIRENIKISAKVSLGHYELKQHKPWFDKDVQNY
jgi:hypothetical protein